MLNGSAYSQILRDHMYMCVYLSRGIQYDIQDTSREEAPVLLQQGVVYQGRDLFIQLSANMGIKVSEAEVEKVVNGEMNCCHRHTK